MPHEILFREKYGSFGEETVYIKPPEQNVLVRLGSAITLPKSFYHALTDIFRQVFLPQGYPESVSNDYGNYQLWDTLQAFCSTISGALTTRAIMRGVGVGDNIATPLSAAVMWIIKDGTGMLGRIVFAWWKGTSLDANCKKWRLFADILNDIAMSLELLLPYFVTHSTHVLCCASSIKAIVGVAGGATRAAITQHQAIRENMADVSAKDGSQETFVNLTASIVGILILSFLSEEEGYAWLFFCIFTIIHLYGNYKAVKSLRLVTFNSERLALLLKTYLSREMVNTPEIVNKEESVFLGCGLTEKELCGFHIEIGMSVKKVLASGMISAEDMKLLANLFRKRKYLLITDIPNRKIFVSLQQREEPVDVIQAYFHSVLLGIGTSFISGYSLPILSGKHSHSSSSLIRRLQGLLKPYASGTSMRIPLEAMMSTDDIICKEFNQFMPIIQSKELDQDFSLVHDKLHETDSLLLKAMCIISNSQSRNHMGFWREILVQF